MNNIVIAKEILRMAKELMALDHPNGTAKGDGEGTKTPFTGIPKVNQESTNSPGQKLRNTVYDAIVNNSQFPEELKDKEDKIRDFVYGFTPNDTVKGFDSNYEISTSSLLFIVHNGEFVINFGTIDGDFYCSNSHLKSLHGCPKEVYGNFACSGNSITSLDGCPEKITGDFYVSDNKEMTSLGVNGKQFIKEISDFYCTNTAITSLKKFPETIQGLYLFNNTKLTSLEGCPEEVFDFSSVGNNSITPEELMTHHPKTVNGTILVDKRLLEAAKNAYPGHKNIRTP